MPDDDQPAPKPWPIPASLVHEARAEAEHIAYLARYLAQVAQFWADPSQVPDHTRDVRGTLPVPDPASTPAEVERAADEMVAALRRARALLEGTTSKSGDEAGRRDERELVRFVYQAAAETEHIAANDPDPMRTVGAIIDSFVSSFHWGFSVKTFAALRTPEARALLVQTLAIKTKRLRAESPALLNERPLGPRWLEPLHEVAKLAKLPAGQSTVNAWARYLDRRSLLTEAKNSRDDS